MLLFVSSFRFRFHFALGRSICPWVASWYYETIGELYIWKKSTSPQAHSEKRKEARRLIAHQKYVVWHRNYGQYLCYFINAREVPPHFIPARKVPPCLGVTGTAEGGTAILYYYGKITAIFRSTGNRRNRYRHISLLRENYHHISLLWENTAIFPQKKY